ncbi:hypothetical protein [Amphritea sp.]|uniref:hypothetical protein n=1 Tax=Amphritea sp. TaxID=1872502 RepID=UPI003D12B49B
MPNRLSPTNASGITSHSRNWQHNALFQRNPDWPAPNWQPATHTPEEIQIPGYSHISYAIEGSISGHGIAVIDRQEILLSGLLPGTQMAQSQFME